MREPFFFSFFFFLRANLEYDLFNLKKSDIFVCLFGLWFGGRVVFCFPRKSQIQGEKGKYFRWEKCFFLWSLPSAIKQWPEFQIAALIFFHIHVLKKKMDVLSHGWSVQESPAALLCCSCNLDVNSQVGKLEVYLLCQRRNQIMSNMPQVQPSNHHKDPPSDSPVAYIH